MINTTISATGEPGIILEPKDLRIGNILLYKGEYVHVTLLDMDIDDEYQEMIGFCKVGRTTDEIADWNRALCDKLSPVPLTPEILAKAGFEKDSKASSLEPVATIYILRIPVKGDNKNEIMFAFVNKGESISFGNATVNDLWASNNFRYLHQLQNLYFALTGEDIILNLL